MSIMFNAPVGVIDQYAQALRRIDKPWGYEIVWALTSDYCGKMLFVEAGHRLSLQFHRRKDETIYLHSGLVQIHIGDPAEAVGPATISPGRSFHIPPESSIASRRSRTRSCSRSLPRTSTTSSGSRMLTVVMVGES